MPSKKAAIIAAPAAAISGIFVPKVLRNDVITLNKVSTILGTLLLTASSIVPMIVVTEANILGAALAIVAKKVVILLATALANDGNTLNAACKKVSINLPNTVNVVVDTDNNESNPPVTEVNPAPINIRPAPTADTPTPMAAIAIDKVSMAGIAGINRFAAIANAPIATAIVTSPFAISDTDKAANLPMVLAIDDRAVVIISIPAAPATLTVLDAIAISTNPIAIAAIPCPIEARLKDPSDAIAGVNILIASAISIMPAPATTIPPPPTFPSPADRPIIEPINTNIALILVANSLGLRAASCVTALAMILRAAPINIIESAAFIPTLESTFDIPAENPNTAPISTTTPVNPLANPPQSNSPIDLTASAMIFIASAIAIIATAVPIPTFPLNLFIATANPKIAPSIITSPERPTAISFISILESVLRAIAIISIATANPIKDSVIVSRAIRFFIVPIIPVPPITLNSTAIPPTNSASITVIAPRPEANDSVSIPSIIFIAMANANTASANFSNESAYI